MLLESSLSIKNEGHVKEGNVASGEELIEHDFLDCCMSGDKDETYSQGSAEFCSQFHSGESELYSLTPCNDDIFCCLGLEASRARRFCWNRACRFASSVGEIGSPEQVRGYELCAGRPGPTFVKFVIKEASSHYNVTHWTRQQQ